jgi:hypothetical protein
MPALWSSSFTNNLLKSQDGRPTVESENVRIAGADSKAAFIPDEDVASLFVQVGH